MITPKVRFGRILQLTLLVMLAVLTGCSGCQDSDEQKLTKEELVKKREREKDALIVYEPLSLPTDSDRKLITVKPGHWHESIQSFKANREDLQVVLATNVLYGNDKANLPSTNFVNEYTRRSTLPKGQEKTIGLQFYVPPTTKRKSDYQVDPNTGVSPSTALRINNELRNVPLMNPIPNSDKRSMANELKPHTFQLMVVGPKILEYQYLSNIDAVRWARSENDFENDRIISYDIALTPPKDNQYTIPHSMLTMTSIAAVIWDDVSSNELSEVQLNAIIDWIHWGGQLIINGPSSWSLLQNSPLAEYLPSNKVETRELSASDFAPMMQSWKTRIAGKSGLEIPIEVADKSMGLKFTLNDRGQWMPGTGELVAEAQVGRGRIVVTGFSLRDPGLVRWSYFSSFFSTGLLRRPPREVRNKTRDMVSLRQTWAPPFERLEMDPAMHSNFRLLSRDLPSVGTSANRTQDASAGEGNAQAGQFIPRGGMPQNTGLADNTVAEAKRPIEPLAAVSYEPAAWGGAGGWTDYSGASIEAITALRAAAGIELPQRSTILKLLGGYLLCLVPLNWLVFKLIRRLEYAWLAAPLMAIAGVIIVGKVARLDIGFARRTTEIAVLECFGDYSRAHLTQYVALYTSLSTNYSVQFPETDSVALPMGDVQREMRRSQSSTRSLVTSFGKSDGVTLEPLTVYSNSTEMLHAEQIVKLESPIRLVTDQTNTTTLVNTSSMPLKAAMLIRRLSKNRIETAWLDALQPGERKPVKWESTDPSNAFENWADNMVTQRTKPNESELTSMDGIWIGGLLNQIGMRTPLATGQTRLIAYTDKNLGELQITPSQDQYDKICVVVSHLTPQTLGPITPDSIVAGREMTVEPNPRSSSDIDSDKALENPPPGL